MTKCKTCFFREISLRQGAVNAHGNPKLWCWLHTKHVTKGYTCRGWLDPDTEGDPKKLGEYYNENRVILRSFMRRKPGEVV